MDRTHFLSIAQTKGFDEAMLVLQQNTNSLFSEKELIDIARTKIDERNYAEASYILSEVEGDGRWYDYEPGDVCSISNIDEALDFYFDDQF